MAVFSFLEGPELVIVLLPLLWLASLGVSIWALVDAAGKPDWAWQRAGSSKALYLVLIIAGFFLCGIVALVTSIIYLASTRQRLAQAMAGGGPPLQQPYYQPYPTGVYPPSYSQQPRAGVPGPPTPPPPAGGPPAPGWWLASDGNFYPPPRPQMPPGTDAT